MGSNALAAVQDFDRARGDARPNRLAQQMVRHRVIVLLDLDVVVEPNRAFLPLGKNVGLGRQRPQRRAFQLIEQRATARTEVTRDAVIELRDQLGDGRVQRREREELSVAQLGDDKASRDLDSNLDLGFPLSQQLLVIRSIKRR